MRVRVIPTLLIQNGRLVKSVKFKNHKYIGDPINAVKIFNEKEVDELVILDISATVQKRGPDINFIQDIISEAFMPLAYGGGLSSVEEIRALSFAGVEKFVINTSAFIRTQLITEAARIVGSQSIVVSVDVKKKMFGGYEVYIENGKRGTDLDPISYCKRMEGAGAGEILLNSIDRDGTYGGFDLNLIREVTSSLDIPVVVIGGAAEVSDFRGAVQAGASAVAAGSMFVYQRPHNAVLISYPDQFQLEEKLFSKIS